MSEGADSAAGGRAHGEGSRTWYVVGGGPAGLTCAQLLGESGERVVLFEAQAQLGGCHAVHRVDGLFSEHGPRICVDNYATFRGTVSRFADFDDLFVPYRATFAGSALQLAGHLSLGEAASFAAAFAHLLLRPSDLQRQTVAEWMARRGFREAARARVDLLCATVEGAGAARMTLFELLDVANQNVGYAMRQPRRANDRALFARWRAHLEGLGCVVCVGERALAVECDAPDGGPRVLRTSRRCVRLRAGDRVVVALPPRPAARLLPFSDAVRSLARSSSYETYLPITFHWRARVQAPSEWGGSRLTPWGVLFVVMSDYLEGEPTGTIVQAVIAFADARSPATGRTAHETDEAGALAEEAWRQLGLPMARFDRAVLSPRVSRRGGRWHNEDTAFLRTKDTPARVADELRPRLHAVGAHNGGLWYSATAMETACASAVAFVNRVVPRSRQVQTPRAAMDLRGLLLALAAVAVVAWVTIFAARSNRATLPPRRGR